MLYDYYYTNDTAIYRWEGWGENFRAYETDLSYDEMINHNQNYRAALQMKTEDANGFCHSDLLG